MSLRDRLKTAKRTVKTFVPKGLDVEVHIIPSSANEMIKVTSMLADSSKIEDDRERAKIEMKNVTKMVALVLCEEDGTKCFDPNKEEDLEELGSYPQVSLLDIWQEACSFGVDAKKN